MAVPEYREILEREALRFDPDVVLVGIYIGNDIRTDSPRGFFSSHGSRLLTAARVLWSVARSDSAYGTSRTLDGMYRFDDGPAPSFRCRASRTPGARGQASGADLASPTPPRSARHGDTERAIEDRCVCRERVLGWPRSPPTRCRWTTACPPARARTRCVAGPLRPGYPKPPPAREADAPTCQLDLTPALRDAERHAHTYHPRAVH
jgi:hypothetical protein